MTRITSVKYTYNMLSLIFGDKVSRIQLQELWVRHAWELANSRECRFQKSEGTRRDVCDRSIDNLYAPYTCYCVLTYVLPLAAAWNLNSRGLHHGHIICFQTLNLISLSSFGGHWKSAPTSESIVIILTQVFGKHSGLWLTSRYDIWCLVISGNDKFYGIANFF